MVSYSDPHCSFQCLGGQFRGGQCRLEANVFFLREANVREVNVGEVKVIAPKLPHRNVYKLFKTFWFFFWWTNLIFVAILLSFQHRFWLPIFAAFSRHFFWTLLPVWRRPWTEENRSPKKINNGSFWKENTKFFHKNTRFCFHNAKCCKQIAYPECIFFRIPLYMSRMVWTRNLSLRIAVVAVLRMVWK